MESKDILSKNLQKFRERTGVSQEEVSFDADISQMECYNKSGAKPRGKMIK